MMTGAAFRFNFALGSCVESLDLRCLFGGRPSMMSWSKTWRKLRYASDKLMTPSGGPFASFIDVRSKRDEDIEDIEIYKRNC